MKDIPVHVPTAPEDRVPAPTKVSYGVGGSIDRWDHWLACGATWFLYSPFFPWLQVFASGSMAVIAASDYMMDRAIGADKI
ncbi:MAG TPA: hypothetical protein VHN79_02025 [Lacunisphaera sp.]|nr:hypothetical protein [Lacunisphaera sp.]